ncbi:MAG: hypothetical protein HC769_07150 [Cyanobacteria bacterium CRU_2_1]|nr:hypothetical protein [Cyanobacteria bacterium RU_5_0]NJR58651.1 hypothetical protein [Cyanobacteria bacterium CRU_2_1]
MDYTGFQSRTIALFLQRQRLTHRRMLEQCNLSLQSSELIIECPDKLATRAVWLRRVHIAKAAPKLGIASIRFK